MNDIETDMLHLAYMQELSALKQQPPIKLDIDRLAVILLIAQVQLACRHPENDGASRHIIEKLARKLQADIAPVGSALHVMLERGWNTRYDVQIFDVQPDPTHNEENRR